MSNLVLRGHVCEIAPGFTKPRRSCSSAASMRIADSPPVEANIQFMVGQDTDLFHGVKDYTQFIWTHLMPPLTGARARGVADMPAVGGTIPAVEPDIGRAAPTVHVASLPVIPGMITYWQMSEMA